MEELKNNWIYRYVSMVKCGLKEKQNKNTPDILSHPEESQRSQEVSELHNIETTTHFLTHN